MPRIAQRFVANPFFDYFIIVLILLSGAFLGLGTVPETADRYGEMLTLGNQIILGVFILEAIMKMVALAPRPQRYFSDGWNVFDFAIIVFSLVPATGAFAMIARLGRLLRVLRLISTIEDLRLIVAALVKSIPNVGHILMLMSIIVYIYAIIGFQLFHEHDPEHWRNIGISVLTLFEIITLEGLGRSKQQGDGAESPRIDLFRKLRHRRHVRGRQPLHRRGDQQPGSGKGRCAQGVATSGIA